jgi:hypothetical protein
VFDSYDLWLVPHSVGIVRQHGSGRASAFGYQADFRDAEQVYTLDMLPQTKFVTRIEGSFQTEADLALEGHAEVPKEAKALMEAMEWLGGDAHLKLSTEAKLLGRISFSVLSPVIQSVGIGKSRIEWLLDEDDKPLLGDQVFFQTVAVAAGTEKLTFHAKAYALIKGSPFGFRAMFETATIEVSCPLAP